MISPQQGMAFMQQMGNLQRPGGAGIGAPPAGSPTQGLIARLMSDNPGGLLGALMKPGNAPVNPGMAEPVGSSAYVPGGQGPAAPGAPMGVANPGGPVPNMLPMAPKLTADSSGDDIWNSYKAAGGGTDVSNSPFVQNSQNAGMGPMGMLGGLMSKFGGGAGGMPQISQREDLRPGWGTQVPPGAVEDPIWPSKY